MPSRWLRKGPDKLKKCSERRTDSCSTETDGCCAVIPCTYCLTWAGYDGTDYGTSTFSDTAWTGTVGGAEFVAYWERNYETGECEFVVFFDGVEVYRKSCYEGQSCRDSSDSAEASIGYETGTLTWAKFEPRPLPTVEDPDTGCRTHFCGNCHCSCECLCVTITEQDGTVYRGEICDITEDDCGAPEWVGTVGGQTISLTLDRDEETGNCIIGGTVGYQDADWTVISSCQGWSASFTLDDYTSVTVTCKECDCEGDGPEETCCGPDRCLPDETCASPLPTSLRINVSGSFEGGGACTCLELDDSLTFYSVGADNPHTGVPSVWAMGFTLCGVSYRYSLSCVDDSIGWRLSFLNGNGSGGNQGNCLESGVFHPDGIVMEKASCSPLVLSGEFFTSGIGCCSGSHLVGLATLNVVIWEE
jgi:hypothetical protein